MTAIGRISRPACSSPSRCGGWAARASCCAAITTRNRSITRGLKLPDNVREFSSRTCETFRAAGTRGRAARAFLPEPGGAGGSVRAATADPSPGHAQHRRAAHLGRGSRRARRLRPLPRRRPALQAATTTGRSATSTRGRCCTSDPGSSFPATSRAGTRARPGRRAAPWSPWRTAASWPCRAPRGRRAALGRPGGGRDRARRGEPDRAHRGQRRQAASTRPTAARCSRGSL